MSSMGGGGSSKGGTQVSQGPFEFGPSQFDLQAIQNALGQSSTAITNRYNQLGMGGSTPEQQDLGNATSLTGGVANQAQAMIGQEQTQDVGNPAFNPALQQPQTTPGTSLSSLGGLASSLGSLAGGL